MSAVADALEGLKREILSISTETAGEAREKLVDFAVLGETVAINFASGGMTVEQAEEAVKNLGLAARSALVNSGYVAQARAVDVANAAFVTAIKLIAAIVV